jgi:hypothetical protein
MRDNARQRATKNASKRVGQLDKSQTNIARMEGRHHSTNTNVDRLDIYFSDLLCLGLL